MRCDPLVVFVVDPDRAIGEGLTALLDTYGMRVRSFSGAETFLEALPSCHAEPVCLLVAADLPGMSGPALLQRLQDLGHDLPALLLLSTSHPDFIKATQHANRISAIEKPLVDGELVEKLFELTHRETPPPSVVSHS